MNASTSALTLLELQNIQATCMADDVAIEMPEMASWSAAEAEAYFLSGGTDKPAPKAVVEASPSPTAPPPTDVSDASANPMWCASGAWTQYSAQKINSGPAVATAPAASVKPPVKATPSLQERFALPSKKPAAKRPRVLALHGSNSNSESTMFQLTILGLTDLEPNDGWCDCTFLEAPHKDGKWNSDIEGDGRSWYVATGEGTLDVSLRYVVSHIEREGPYDGAYGFSQGASILTLLSERAVWLASGGSTEAFPPWRFLLFGCGTDRLVSAQYHPALPPTPLPLAIPSVHLVGKKDHILAESRSLVSRYEGSIVLEHPEGHSVPMSLAADPNGPILRGIDQFVKKHCSL